MDVYICLNILQNNKEYLKEVQNKFSERYKFQTTENQEEKQQNLENQLLLHSLQTCQQKVVDMKNKDKLDLLLDVIHDSQKKELKDYLDIQDTSIQVILSGNPQQQKLLKQVQYFNKIDQVFQQGCFTLKNQ